MKHDHCRTMRTTLAAAGSCLIATLVLLAAALAADTSPRQAARLVVQTGHTDVVATVAFSPDGKLILTGSNDGSARLWEVRTGQEIRRLTGRGCQRVTAVAFSLDGQLAATAELTEQTDPIVDFWDPATGASKGRLAVAGGRMLFALAFSPDGHTVLVGGVDNTARLCDIATGRELLKLAGFTMAVTSASFSPDGKLALTAAELGEALVWDARTGKRVSFADYRPSSELGLGVASADARYTETSVDDNTVRLWDNATGRPAARFSPHQEGLPAGLAVTPDARTLAELHPTGISLYDITSARLLREIKFPTGAFKYRDHAIYSPDGRYLFIYGGSSEPLNSPQLWDTETGAKLQDLAGRVTPVGSLAWCGGDADLLATDWRGTTVRWDVSSARALRRFQTFGWRSPTAMTPDGRLVLVAAVLCDAQTGREVRRFQDSATKTINDLALSQDGRCAAVVWPPPDWKLTNGLPDTGDALVIFWDTETGRELCHFRDEDGLGRLNCPRAFSSQCLFAQSVGLNGLRVVVWDPRRARQVAQLDGHTQTVTYIAFCLDGTSLLTQA